MVDFPAFNRNDEHDATFLRDPSPEDYAPKQAREQLELYEETIKVLKHRVEEQHEHILRLEGLLRAADRTIVRLAVHCAVTDAELATPFKRSLPAPDTD
jgi:predicted RNase H-like nuclease (RuvC/YqgF family)